MKGINKMGGLARGCEPDGTADELSKKEGEAAKPEPPGEVIAEAFATGAVEYGEPRKFPRL